MRVSLGTYRETRLLAMHTGVCPSGVITSELAEQSSLAPGLPATPLSLHYQGCSIKQRTQSSGFTRARVTDRRRTGPTPKNATRKNKKIPDTPPSGETQALPRSGARKQASLPATIGTAHSHQELHSDASSRHTAPSPSVTQQPARRAYASRTSPRNYASRSDTAMLLELPSGLRHTPGNIQHSPAS